MGNADGKRWRQRLDGFAAATARLRDTLRERERAP